jgi:hypothetical protein
LRRFRKVFSLLLQFCYKPICPRQRRHDELHQLISRARTRASLSVCSAQLSSVVEELVTACAEVRRRLAILLEQTV